MFHLCRVNEEKFDSVRQRAERAKPIAIISRELQSFFFLFEKNVDAYY